MRISFDLDETIICYGESVPQEPRLPWYLRLLVRDEPLRQGTRQLVHDLQSRGWEVWIHTTSFRRPAAVQRWLRCHRIHVAGVINQHLHEAQLRRTPMDRIPTKNPAAFGIALHIDDSEGVRQEGEAHGFRVLVISRDDEDWTDRVLLAADAVLAPADHSRSVESG